MLAGGAPSFVGVLLLGPVLVPALIRLVGRAAGVGPVRRLAAGNAVRNPRRTATTAASLLVGVTLTTAVLTGLASSRTAIDRDMDDELPARRHDHGRRRARSAPTSPTASTPSTASAHVAVLDGTFAASIGLRLPLAGGRRPVAGRPRTGRPRPRRRRGRCCRTTSSRSCPGPATAGAARPASSRSRSRGRERTLDVRPRRRVGPRRHRLGGHAGRPGPGPAARSRLWVRPPTGPTPRTSAATSPRWPARPGRARRRLAHAAGLSLRSTPHRHREHPRQAPGDRPRERAHPGQGRRTGGRDGGDARPPGH